MPALVQTTPELLPILEDLRHREPVFHRPKFPTAMSPDFWEIGASGRRYSREFILQTLEQNLPVDADAANWQLSDFALQQLSPDTYLLTYTLNQQPRRTRRATLWRSTPEGWQVLYHQGTIVAAEEDDIAPQS